MARGKQMTPVDTAWLRMDRPNNLMMIVSLLILDGPVDSNRLIRLLDHRLTAIPRFRQRVEKNSHGYAWVDDAHFSINAHIRRTRLPAPGGSAELARFASELATQPLSRARALWQLHIVEDYDGGAALVVRIHHAIADGIALVGIMLSLTDSTPDADLAGIAATPNLPRTIEKRLNRKIVRFLVRWRRRLRTASKFLPRCGRPMSTIPAQFGTPTWR
jgi:WS/DGAT/MGAT family acyltransferase